MEKKEGDLSHSYKGFCMGRASEIGKWMCTYEEIIFQSGCSMEDKVMGGR